MLTPENARLRSEVEHAIHPRWPSQAAAKALKEHPIQAKSKVESAQSFPRVDLEQHDDYLESP